jgi:uncharacterized membrane protein YedE/YeeE
MSAEPRHLAAAFACGAVFGLGLAVSGMTDPAVVLGFLDVAGRWNPALVFVMAGALVFAFAGFRLAGGRAAPVLAARFGWPTSTAIDARLLAGAALFGLGWGLAGYCPGPAVASLVTLAPGTLIFVAAMLAGMAATRAWLGRAG